MHTFKKSRRRRKKIADSNAMSCISISPCTKPYKTMMERDVIDRRGWYSSESPASSGSDNLQAVVDLHPIFSTSPDQSKKGSGEVSHLARRRTEDQSADGISGHLDALKRAEDRDLAVSQHNSRASSILNREPCLAGMSSNATNGAGEMVAVQRLDIFDFERLDVERVHAQQSDGVFCSKACVVGCEEVDGFLEDRALRLGGVFAGLCPDMSKPVSLLNLSRRKKTHLELDASLFRVHAHLEATFLNKR